MAVIVDCVFALPTADAEVWVSELVELLVSCTEGNDVEDGMLLLGVLDGNVNVGRVVHVDDVVDVVTRCADPVIWVSEAVIILSTTLAGRTTVPLCSSPKSPVNIPTVVSVAMMRSRPEKRRGCVVAMSECGGQ